LTIQENKPQISPLRCAPVEMTNLFVLKRLRNQEWKDNFLRLNEFVISTGAYPDFLRAALDTTACAAFIKESRRKLASATNLNRKSGVAEWRDLR
jgi:hypothetical protein